MSAAGTVQSGIASSAAAVNDMAARARTRDRRPSPATEGPGARRRASVARRNRSSSDRKLARSRRVVDGTSRRHSSGRSRCRSRSRLRSPNLCPSCARPALRDESVRSCLSSSPSPLSVGRARAWQAEHRERPRPVGRHAEHGLARSRDVMNAHTDGEHSTWFVTRGEVHGGVSDERDRAKPHDQDHRTPRSSCSIPTRRTVGSPERLPSCSAFLASDARLVLIVVDRLGLEIARTDQRFHALDVPRVPAVAEQASRADENPERDQAPASDLPDGVPHRRQRHRTREETLRGRPCCFRGHVHRNADDPEGGSQQERGRAVAPHAPGRP